MKDSSILRNVKIHPLLSGIGAGNNNTTSGDGNISSKRDNPYLENNLKVNANAKSTRRAAGPIRFVQPGSIKKKEDEIRLKEQIERLEASLEHELWEEDFGNEISIEPEEHQPLWWDLPFLASDTDESWLTSLVHRPPLILDDCNGDDNSSSFPAPAPLHLTHKERAKLRRQARLEKQKEKREEVLLGLAEAPKDRIRLSTLARLPQNTGTNVTEIELQIRKDQEERRRLHLLQNQERSSFAKENQTPLVKGDKLCVAIYRILPLSKALSAGSTIPLRLSLTNGPKQHRLQGLLLEFNQSLQDTPIEPSKDSFTFLVVEGEEKWLRKYKKKILLKTKWPSQNFCKLIWEGKPLISNYTYSSNASMFSHHSMPGISIRKSNTLEEVKHILESLKISALLSYWNLARSSIAACAGGGASSSNDGWMESLEFF